MHWFGSWNEDGMNSNDIPYRRIAGGCGSRVRDNNGTWCPILLKNKEHHWIEYKDSSLHEECSNKICLYKRKNKKDGFRCLYFKCHPEEIK